jgi:3-phytase
VVIRPFQGFAIMTLAIAASCATVPLASIMGDPAVTVTAAAETPPVGTARADAADDPAIWRNPANPAASLIVGTDKKGGLYVYDIKGAQKSFLAAPGLNNVDLIELPDGRVFAVASDRSNLATGQLFIARLDTASGKLAFVTRVAVGPGEGYGVCGGDIEADGSFVVYSAFKSGAIYRTALQFIGSELADETELLNAVPTQTEGCIYDPRTGMLYIGEEDAGIWAMFGRFEGGRENRVLVAAVDSKLLVADVEGLAIAPEGENGGYLVASSQGDNAFAVFRLPDVTPVGRFRIAAGAFGSVEETDGIALDNRDFGPDFPVGIFVAQDGVNTPKAQNFKYARWDAILEALGERR